MTVDERRVTWNPRHVSRWREAREGNADMGELTRAAEFGGARPSACSYGEVMT